MFTRYYFRQPEMKKVSGIIPAYMSVGVPAYFPGYSPDVTLGVSLSFSPEILLRYQEFRY